MAAPVYVAAAGAALRSAPLDAFTAIYDRRSGITHLLSAPAPEILALLAGDGLSAAALFDRLTADFDLVDASPDSLAARLDELVAAGLVAVR